MSGVQTRRKAKEWESSTEKPIHGDINGKIVVEGGQREENENIFLFWPNIIGILHPNLL